QAARAVHELGRVMRDLVADDAVRIGQGLRAAHLGDAALVHRDGETAGVRAVEGADAGALETHVRLHPRERTCTITVYFASRKVRCLPFVPPPFSALLG